MKHLIIAFLAISMIGCAKTPRIDRNDPLSIAQQITYSIDQYNKTISLKGPNGNTHPDAQGGEVFLRTTIGLNGDLQTLQVYGIYRYYGEWAFLDRATDINGNQMKFVQIDRDVLSCSSTLYGCLYSEHFALNISPDYLMSAQKNGIAFKAYGKAGSKEYRLSPAYILAFLSEIDKRMNN